jgi:hypothetical protein
MLWYKSWLDTRWRFLVPLVILAFNIWGLIFEYAQVAKVLPTLHTDGVGEGALGRAIQEVIEAERTFRGFVWYQWFRQNLMQMGTVFAALLGSGSLFTGPTSGTMFTLSLPVSRNRWLATRTVIGLGELLALAVIPSLVIPVASTLIGQHYDVSTALVHSLCLFVVCAMFFCFALLFSTMFADTWRPLLFACGIALVAGLLESEIGFYGFFRVMSGWTYYRTASVPWIGLFVSAAISAALLYGAAVNVARKDF